MLCYVFFAQLLVVPSPTKAQHLVQCIYHKSGSGAIGMNLQQLLQAIKNNSSRPEDLIQLLNQLKVSEESLKGQPQKLADAIGALDPIKESLGYLYLL